MIAAQGRFDFDKAKRELPLSQLCEQGKLPPDRLPRLISAMPFSPTLESSFSGSTFHLSCAGLAIGKLEGCFSLYSGENPLRALQLRGAFWKLERTLRRQKRSGFKFTSAYLDTVWPRYIDSLAGSNIINNFQMYGPEFYKRRKALDIGAYFYIDGTLTEYFETYGGFEVADIDPVTRKHALAVEREDYLAADGVVAMSKLTAQSLRQDYGVPAEKISIVVPGANLVDATVDSVELSLPGSNDEFVLGFVGLYPLRKGLDRLAAAVRILRGRGLPIRLRVVGKCPDDLKSMDGLEFLGIIDKRTDLTSFLKVIGSVQLGCLLSRSELTGIAMLEFLRLGVPILGTQVGGLSDILEGGGSLGVQPDIEPEELAEVIANLYHDQARYRTLKVEAHARRHWASWKRVANHLDALVP